MANSEKAPSGQVIDRMILFLLIRGLPPFRDEAERMGDRTVVADLRKGRPPRPGSTSLRGRQAVSKWKTGTDDFPSAIGKIRVASEDSVPALAAGLLEIGEFARKP